MERLFRPDGTVRRRWRQPETPRWLDELAESLEIHEINTDSVFLAWELSRLANEGLTASEERILVTLVLASLVSIRQGSTRLGLADQARDWFLENYSEVIEPDALDEFLESARLLLGHEALRPIVGAPGDYKPLIVVDEWLYHHRLYHYERELVAAIGERDRAGAAESTPDRDEIEGILAEASGLALSEEQLNAIEVALRAPLSIITGGPGTGKTSIVVSLLRVLHHLGVTIEEIALAAPTGKAANRMAESIREQISTDEEAAELAHLEPSTLHRLLDYSRRRREFRHSADNPLKHNFIIVDEASMIDLVLMQRLISAVRPDARLLLLGDAEQLPSVETGTVLRDLVPHEGDEVAGSREAVRLSHSYRMDASKPEGRAILELAEEVRNGRSGEAFERLVERNSATQLEFAGVEILRTSEDDDSAARRALRDFLDHWYHQRVRSLDELEAYTTQRTYRLRDGTFGDEDVECLDILFDHFNHCRILCLTRVFATGSNAINELFHRRVMQAYQGLSESTQFVPGEPVLMLKNDYERHLFNGDQGLILRVDTDGEGRFMAVFPDAKGYKAHHLQALRGQLDHAFAMTVHKSQGSEFDDVAVVLPEDDLPLLTREILYTAITRARRSVSICGRRGLFEAGVHRQIRRFSGVREALS